MKRNAKEIPEHLIRLMEPKGLHTIKDISDATGIHVSRIYYGINHGRFSERTAEALSELLGCEPERPKTTETMMVDGEPTEIDPLSHEVGYTRGQSERPKGEWVRTKNPVGETIVVCSNCGKIRQQGYDNFCGFCGADCRGNDYQRHIEDLEHCMRYEPTFNPEDGSM